MWSPSSANTAFNAGRQHRLSIWQNTMVRVFGPFSVAEGMRPYSFNIRALSQAGSNAVNQTPMARPKGNAMRGLLRERPAE